MKFTPKFFSLLEFRCKCGCGKTLAAPALVAYLETLRWAWGAPIIVTSGYRCPAHNAEVGGAARSRHMLGCAADIRPADPALFPAFRHLVHATVVPRPGWEYRAYATWVHVGVPRAEADYTWAGGSLSVEVR